MQRPKWDVDRRLEANLGQDVRVAAAAFRPIDHLGAPGPRWISIKELILPDNREAADLPVFFEGKLESFIREAAIVSVQLGDPRCPRSPANGTVHFRGRCAAVLQGPAQVQLAYPFSVEKLPSDSDNYWEDLRRPKAQFTFPFVDTSIDKTTASPLRRGKGGSRNRRRKHD
ncbi:MAG: hypothetical protein KJ072_22415 [Verrucomicrobia bacterium]|nr:hypothetical protein [Verrucomicrobiota bacterium]